MVAIFFAISGYVLCRHIIRLIHDGDRDAVYRNLSSSVFRRIFRLYIPPTISMLLVALLAQTGAFRSEAAVYTGADSVYVNGSLVIAQAGDACVPGSLPVSDWLGVADFMGLRNSEHLGNGTILSDALCLSRQSLLLSPVALYGFVEKLETLPARKGASSHELAPEAHNRADDKDLKASVDNAIRLHKTDSISLHWVQYGGSWEEHPFIHDNLTCAIRNFTRTYAEWANPFNFNHYHTRYDPHTYTMPIELRGSMLIYLFLLGTLGLNTIWRLSLAGLISFYSLAMGRWDMATFLGGAMLSDIDIWNSSTSMPAIVGNKSGNSTAKRQLSPSISTIIRWMVFVVALYLLSYPDVGAEYTPGFVVLSWLVPRYYLPLAGWMFYHSIGALLLLPCIVQTRHLRDILESPVAQYLGKISFSIYLVHGPLLHSLGFWIMPRLFERFGRAGGYLVGWASLFSTTLYLAHWWHKKVDVWSTTVGRRVERLLTN